MAWIWSSLAATGCMILAVLVGFAGWFAWMTRSLRPMASGYEYIMVNEDGSAREVSPTEREYLETEFSPADGARPYIKLRYESRDGWGSIQGFLLRRRLPSAIPIRQPTEEENQAAYG